MPSELSGKAKSYIQDYYRDRIFPLLSPQIIDRSHPFPHLKNKVLYGVALLTQRDKELLGIVEVPESLPPIILLPGENAQYVRTEEVIRSQLHKIFKAYHITEESVVTVTRNADINYSEAILDALTGVTSAFIHRMVSDPEKVDSRKAMEIVVRLVDSLLEHERRDVSAVVDRMERHMSEQSVSICGIPII